MQGESKKIKRRIDEGITNRERYERIQYMYNRVIVSEVRRCRSIKCPECGQRIAISISLSEMADVIEDHIEIHRSQDQSNILFGQTRLLGVRLDLAKQVLCKLDLC